MSWSRSRWQQKERERRVPSRIAEALSAYHWIPARMGKPGTKDAGRNRRTQEVSAYQEAATFFNWQRACRDLDLRTRIFSAFEAQLSPAMSLRVWPPRHGLRSSARNTEKGI